MKKCIVDGCGRKHRSLGYCQKHYRKFKKYGNPLAGYEIELHGMRNIPEYKIWYRMIDRCYNPKATGYKNYGGRGIQICDRWNIPNNKKQSILNFLEDIGKRPSNKSSIDRINNNKGYYKENCRWSSPKLQIRNQRRTKLNEDIVAKIRKLFAEGYRKIEISKMFTKLTYNNIWNILKKNPDGSWFCWKPVRKIKS
ncbi:hypothetical protein LCGC14_1400760 [marine sediment metagenome]|uniref:Nuclease associated modular domain-containing protein n=1 Tax=marine sediment metagenome TaxID=412755 RepID=A0A0F9MYR7_9ZZZZ